MATTSSRDIAKAKTEMEKKWTKTKKKINVLIVDDDKFIRRIHQQIITKLGGVSNMAENGEVAVNLLEGGANFDLILTDKEMPVRDGIWMTRKLREMKVSSKIIGVTSVGEEERKAFMEAGLDHCVAKPLSEAKLRPLISDLLEDA